MSQSRWTPLWWRATTWRDGEAAVDWTLVHVACREATPRQSITACHREISETVRRPWSHPGHPWVDYHTCSFRHAIFASCGWWQLLPPSPELSPPPLWLAWHHCLLAVSGVSDHISKPGQLHWGQLLELDGYQILEVSRQQVKEDGLEEVAGKLSRWQGHQHSLHPLNGPPAAEFCPPQDAGALIQEAWMRCSTSLFFSSVKGSPDVSARLKMPLTLSIMWWGMCGSTVLYITCADSQPCGVAPPSLDPRLVHQGFGLLEGSSSSRSM